VDDDDTEGEMGDPMEGSEGVKLTLDCEEDVIRKIGDPKLPSDNEVEVHRQRGHIPYRSWCHVCVSCPRVGTRSIVGIKGRSEYFPNIVGIIVSLGINSGINGPFLLGKSGDLEGGWQRRYRTRVAKVNSLLTNVWNLLKRWGIARGI
jgi:hypothetical protein